MRSLHYREQNMKRICHLFSQWFLVTCLVICFVACANADANRNILTVDAAFTATVFRGGRNLMYRFSSNAAPTLVAEDVTCVNLSPDGARIAYSNQGDIFIQKTDSVGQQVLDIGFWDLGQPVWSPDGTHLAFSGAKDGPASFQIWLTNVATGELEQISDCEGNAGQCSVSYPDWSRDNRVIYWMYKRGNGSILEYDVATKGVVRSYSLEGHHVSGGNPFGSQTTDVQVKYHQAGQSVVRSPDGIHLAIVDEIGIIVLDIQKQNIINVVRRSGLSESFDSPSWSSDGKWLLFRKLRLQQRDFWEVVGYDAIITNMDTGLSSGRFEFRTLYSSSDPLMCPNQLIVTH